MGIYTQAGTFDLPSNNAVFDSVSDGSLITTDGSQVMKETAPGSRQFVQLGTVISGDPTFLRVNAFDFGKAAIGHYQTANRNVVVFSTLDPKQQKQTPTDNFDAEWLAPNLLAITAGPPSTGDKAVVLVLDISTWAIKTLVNNCGCAWGGVTIDQKKRLFVGDGLSPAVATDVTGEIKAFPEALWRQALATGVPLDFDSAGTTVATIESAATLGFDVSGNLHVGGGNFATGDKGYAGIIAASAIEKAIAGGSPVTASAPSTVLQKLDPTPANNFWLVTSNRVLSELYLNDYGNKTVYVYKPT